MVKEIPKLHGPVDKFKKKAPTINICGPNVPPPPPPKRRLGAFSGPGRPFTNPKRRSAVLLEGRFRIICNVKMWWARRFLGSWSGIECFLKIFFLGVACMAKNRAASPPHIIHLLLRLIYVLRVSHRDGGWGLGFLLPPRYGGASKVKPYTP